MAKTGYFVVIPTHDRPDDLRECVQSIAPEDRMHPVDEVIIIDNNSIAVAGEGTIIIEYDDYPPNISTMWNIGLEKAREIAYPNYNEWFVAILNDDVVVPLGWFEAVVYQMQRYGADAGCSDQFSIVSEPLLNRRSGTTDLFRRLCGYAMVLRGTSALRFDENMAWWFSDDDMDWCARDRGGMLIIPGYPVVHKYPSAQTNARPELAAQTGRDRAAFEKKWGTTPW